MTTMLNEIDEEKAIVLKTGQNELFSNPDADLAREAFRNKSRALKPKLSTVEEVVRTMVHDGDYVTIGGFGANRIPTAILHEMVRQGKKHLGFAGHTSTHDFQILCAGECFDRLDIAYIIGLEARGLSPNARRYIESGKVKLTEWTNATLSWRIKAAAMGLSFLPARNIMGTDTFKYSAAKEILCPFTGQKYVAFPALYPDFAAIHVHECDVYGNAHLYGSSVSDQDLAKASKRVVLTTERIIPNEQIRQNPSATFIPYWCVDAVVEVPYGSYPGNMPYEYFSDEAHIKEWLKAEKDPDEFRKFIDRQIFGTKNFYEYLELNGGIEKMKKLRAAEFLIPTE
ncbi:MAG TPA: CoA-transferase [Deltaproteobacteria bacterium]|jgi:glutaconate CoA-transferase subunit A|nr:CoA-transferase [Deltaproteobacteria bacterium]HQI00858.1 CoA-transferase [Deltaproteobacteria bacterium]